MSSPRDSDSLHEEIQAHIGECDQCRRELDRGKPRRFGQASGYCGEYFGIIARYKPPEGTMHDV